MSAEKLPSPGFASSASQPTAPPPPYNVEAEQALLGALLVENRLYRQVAGFLAPEHFGNALHGRIYEAVSRGIEKGELTNPVLLASYFQNDPAFDRFGDAGRYLVSLARGAINLLDVASYGEAILDLYRRRQIMMIAETMAREAALPDLSAEGGAATVAAKAIAQLETISAPTTGWRQGVEGKAPAPTKWVIDGIAVPGSTLLLSGDGEIGKSILTLQLCAAAAAREPWLGLPVEPGRSVFLACEDDEEEVRRRLCRIAKVFDLGLWHLADVNFLCRPGDHSALIEFDRWSREPRSTGLFREVWQKAKKVTARYIVIDTATATFAGNQNDDREVMAYLMLLRKLAMQTGAVVVINKHPSVAGRKTTGESGSVAWVNGVRSRCWLHKKEGMLELLHAKCNYGRRIEPIPLEWRHGVIMRRDAGPPERPPF